jgi:hypothetical protein
MEEGDQLIFKEQKDKLILILNHAEKAVENFQYPIDSLLVDKYKRLDSLFENISFAKPFLAPDLKALRNYHEEALSY